MNIFIDTYVSHLSMAEFMVGEAVVRTDFKKNKPFYLSWEDKHGFFSLSDDKSRGDWLPKLTPTDVRAAGHFPIGDVELADQIAA